MGDFHRPHITLIITYITDFVKYERIIKMKNYQVKFKGFSAFTDTIIVYDVASRQEAIQSVKEHYGSSVKIISAKLIKD